MIPKSTSYGLAKDGVLIAKGSAKEMHRLSKKHGGSKAGYAVWLTPSPVGTMMWRSLDQRVVGSK